MIVAVPLCEQFREKCGGEGIGNTACKHVRIESTGGEFDSVELVLGFEDESPIRLEGGIDVKTDPISTEEIAETHA